MFFGAVWPLGLLPSPLPPFGKATCPVGMLTAADPVFGKTSLGPLGCWVKLTAPVFWGEVDFGASGSVRVGRDSMFGVRLTSPVTAVVVFLGRSGVFGIPEGVTRGSGSGKPMVPVTAV